ncbi:MAG: hypothetical protein FJY88_12445 [Candidatus Eisenbacteria bacterium]|nr:hypothetical protein [Candidatus Eisenbacteria bacterium]
MRTSRIIHPALAVTRLFAHGVLILGPLAAPALAEDPVDDPFGPLRPLLGKTWKGEMARSTSEKPVFDISHWELALNG